jgi:hypothetical protein
MNRAGEPGDAVSAHLITQGQQKQRNICWQQKHVSTLKGVLVLGILLIPISNANAKMANISCPGENTVEMRYCAGASLDQSNTKLKKVMSGDQLKQWQETTRAICFKAYTAYKEGSIYPQLTVGCEDNLNRALLKEFEPLEN